VPVGEVVGAAVRARGGEAGDVEAALRREAARLEVRDEFLTRGVNDEFSGGEQKRVEALQLAVLAPRFAMLDEIDSGLDVDALRDVARRIEAMTSESDLGVLAITHYTRLLTELRADHVHVMMAGRVVASGGPELADRLEEIGYEGLAAELGVESLSVERPADADPFAEPGF
jgi:Fe-S cluster assembly ATP-binding protein